MGESQKLGETLRRLRRERGMTGTELASSIGVRQGTISKIECGRLVPDLEFLTKFMHLLRVQKDEAARLMRLAGVMPGGTTPESVLQYLPVDFLQVDWAQRRQETVALAEERSLRISGFNPLFVPGLLQTENYGREILKAAGVRGPRVIERAMPARLRRQRALQTPGKQVTFILTEGALLTRFGPRDVLAEQIQHLQQMAASGRVTFGIIASNTRLGVIPPPAFHLFDRRVYVELPHGDLWLLDHSHAYDTYHQLFGVLADHALVGAELHAKLDQLMARLHAH